jgi:1-deoxy-D-xylulose-5-phosphate reductoisomerase
MNLSILGSTGSIGIQTLELARCFPDIQITALAAMSSIEKMYRQIHEFDPEICCIYDEQKAEELRARLKAEGSRTEIVSGMEGLIACAVHPHADTVLISVVGMIGIRPTIEAIKAGKNIAQANKEPIVCAGHLIMPLAKQYGVRFTPVDSEHSAIYQCLRGEEHNRIDKIWLTASGGPFLGRTREELKGITPQDALKHPSWNMGAKITIDSSTLVNKGLEVIEAHYLFGVPADDIIVAVQPGSVVHSMVQFEDGAVKAQLGAPDMKVPIAYALHCEHRMDFAGKKTLSFEDLREIRFQRPDPETFKGLKLGIEACRQEGTLTTVYNAANEECVAAFLAGKIGYLDIADGIEAAMLAHSRIEAPDTEQIFEAEREARLFIRERYKLNS